MSKRAFMAAVVAVAISVAFPVTAAASTPPLARAVNSYWRALGFHRDATKAVNSAHLPKAVASALTAELSQLHACDVITRAHVNVVVNMFSQFTGGHTGFALGQPAVNPIPVQ